MADGLKGATFTLILGGLAIPGYAAVYSVAVNLIVTIALSLLFGAHVRK